MPTSHLRIVAAPQGAQEDDRPDAGTSQLAFPATLQRYEGGRLAYHKDSIAVEAPLRLQVEGVLDTTLSRTPGDDMNLVAGHLFSLNMIRGSEDLSNVTFNYRGRTRVSVVLKTTGAMRRLFPSPRPVRVRAERLFDFKETFERRQNLFKSTGSTHAAALFSASGEMIAFGEDVGRHNAFDKAIGRSLLEGTLDEVAIAMLSSRLALELAVKAQAANIPILCGFSAATSSGIDYAERNNLTLVGRLRNGSFYLYSNGWRILS
ncbi:formate dehydrogenase accessory sulfurtransferase FdhD [Pseudodesulfovibrio portus]|uniref:Protein FdhD n=1 Tax=Pseudodesulfovibrio portus TaxID=231439 RepID=A0ABM8AQ03_9BACT|nr:formate dehydrogenase accessory sulfurtransferase FdhD [Pseudodesulfovibrio portus]BDQ33495.1 sulfurtransferase FdhD [Pseudodesulfovibrio portus]